MAEKNLIKIYVDASYVTVRVMGLPRYNKCVIIPSLTVEKR